MAMSRRKALATGAALPAAGLLAGAAYGQQTGAAKDGPPRDALLAACLLIGGRKQIEKCQLAMKKLATDDTKAFAKAEIEEHQTIAAKLKELGYEYPAPVNANPGGAPGRPADGPPAISPLRIGKVTLPQEASELVQVDHEVAVQCLANFQAAMNKKEGLKFEKAFVGDQKHEHMGLLDRAQVFQRHASPAMQPVLKEGQQIIERHLATLEELMNRLDAMKDERK